MAEDEPTIAVTLADALEEAGHEVRVAGDTDAAFEALEARVEGSQGQEDSAWPEVVLTDIRLPGAGGMEILRRSIELDPLRPVIVMTGYATVDQAVEAMRIGARNYVQKPFRNESMVAMVETYSRVQDLERENRSLRAALDSREGFENVVGQSEAMRGVFERVRTVAASDVTVLIQGESGTGKERIARAIHGLSPRADEAFVAISCAALPESLLEAELFGYEKGAFTDARKDRRGRFELASGGTLFLDDIDDMPLPVQVKLLRVLQEKSFERLGSESTIEVDIRVLAATKVDLHGMVRDDAFREDLYYRIHVVPIVLPPVRERDGDVALLVEHLIERHGKGRAYRLSSSTLRALERYPWPGNVRELENAVQRGIALAGSRRELAVEDLLPLDDRWRGATRVQREVLPLRDVVKLAEREHIEHALECTGGHRTQTAELLGISRKVLWEKMRAHGLQESSDSTKSGGDAEPDS